MNKKIQIIIFSLMILLSIISTFSFANTPQLIPFRYGDKWGYCDQDKNVFIPCTYDEAFPFQDGVARVREDFKGYGLIEIHGNKLVPCSYKYIFDFSDGVAKVCDYNNKCGLIDIAGKPLTEMKYDYINEFHEGFAKVELNNKYGFIDLSGHEITPLIYKNANDFHENLAAVKDTNRLYGFIDKTGKEIIPFKYCMVKDLNNGLAPFAKEDTNHPTGGYEGYLDEYGNELEKNHETNARYYGGLYPDKQDNKYGLLNSKGEIVVPYTYKNIENFINGFAQVTDASGYLGFIDTTGKEITPLQYYGVYDFSVDGFARVSLRGIGFINRLGEEIIEPKYGDDDIGYDFSEGLIYVKENNKTGFLDTLGILRIPYKYKTHKYMGSKFKDGLAKVELDGREFYIDKNGTEYYKEYVPPKRKKKDILPQALMPDTEVREIKSTFVDDTYQITIALPKDYYKTNKTYPVLYLLDADYLLGTVRESAFMMAFGKQIPEMIIVGITYNGTFDDWYQKRIRDFCPTESYAVKAFQGGGGADNFLKFIQNELIPLIEMNYRIVPDERVLVGYSLGGLFGAYTLFEDPDLFNRYILISPSFWWDDTMIFDNEKDFSQNNDELQAQVFLSLGAKEYEDFMFVKKFNDIINTRNYKGLLTEYKTIPGEEHTSTFAPAFVIGIQSIFE
ncbi:MAG: WG repeat-containing protein [Candidatus Cloacimonetes bacterium]|nr:WG repeat-containing protein [Candidatus Cloacimonadota bacterium]